MTHQNVGESRCDWRTPKALLDPARAVFGDDIGLDPFSAHDNPTGAKRFYTEADDGFSAPWDVSDAIFVNPPWSKKLGIPIAWPLALVWAHADQNPDTQLIVVTPASVNARWFHRYCVPAAAKLFPNKRVVYEPPPGMASFDSPNFDTAVLYFGPRPEVFAACFGHLGWIPGYTGAASGHG